MKKLLSVFLLFPMFGHAQLYTRAEIKHAADSIMRTFLRADMYAACVGDLDNDHYTFYTYQTTSGKMKKAEVPRQPGVFTKGKFRSVTILYSLRYPYPKCKTNNVVAGTLSVTLDRHLDMQKAPDIAFIPDYVWENDSCRSRSHTIR